MNKIVPTSNVWPKISEFTIVNLPVMGYRYSKLPEPCVVINIGEGDDEHEFIGRLVTNPDVTTILDFKNCWGAYLDLDRANQVIAMYQKTMHPIRDRITWLHNELRDTRELETKILTRFLEDNEY